MGPSSKAFVTDDERFFWVEPVEPLRALSIAKTQREYRITVALGGRLVKSSNQDSALGELCISVISQDELTPTIFTDVPLWEDMEWFLGAFKPKSIKGRLIDVSPDLLREIVDGS